MTQPSLFGQLDKPACVVLFFEGTRAEQIARIGNAVCPPVAEAIVRALGG